jgi:predicted dehydrogenase
VIRGLQAGKHVFVEKPLCLTLTEVKAIREAAYAHPECLLMVGFNRRFSPLIQKMQSLLEDVAEPKAFVMTVNAGYIPSDHWTQDRQIGGGRIIGEACHFVDLLRYLARSPIVSYQVSQIGEGVETRDDKATITLHFEDGSFGTIHYFANGHKSYPKERLEVFCAGRILQLDNFRVMRGFGWKRFKKMCLWRQDKGQKACVEAFVDAVQSAGVASIPLEEILEVSRTVIEIAHELVR